MENYKQRLKDITTFIFDVDGVLTDGGVLVLENQMVRTFNSKDSYAIQYAAKLGFNVFIITGGGDHAVLQRLMDLGASDVRLRATNKLDVYEDLKKKHKFEDQEALYMGDDIPDYRIMEIVGIAACPQDAATEIKEIAHYQSPFFGGKCCVRDVIEQTLRAQKLWFTEEAHQW